MAKAGMKKKKAKKRDDWIDSINELREMEERYGPQILYRTALMGMIVSMAHSLKREHIPYLISTLVNEQLLNFDQCYRKAMEQV